MRGFFRRLTWASVLLTLGSIVMLGSLAYGLWYLEQIQDTELPEPRRIGSFRRPVLPMPIVEVDWETAEYLIAADVRPPGLMFPPPKCKSIQVDFVEELEKKYLAPPVMPNSFIITIEIPKEEWDRMMTAWEAEEAQRFDRRVLRWIQSWVS